MTDTKNMSEPVLAIHELILQVRGHRVIMGTDLARLYGVSTKRLNEQVKRNARRFPEDFVFQLTPQEKAEVVANCDHLSQLRFSPAMPYVFTEHGTIMVASVLNTDRAVEVSVYVVRAFVKFRQLLAGHETLVRKLDELENRVDHHDESIRALVSAIRGLMASPHREPQRSIGFREKEGR